MRDNRGWSKYSDEAKFRTDNAGFPGSQLLNAAQDKQLMAFYGGAGGWQLCYRGSRDGFKAADFHRQCDGKSETMVIIRSSNGNLFGGYTPMDWTSSGGYKPDASGRSFIYSLVNATGNPVKLANVGTQGTNQYSIWTRSDYGAVFGSAFDLCIHNDCNTNTGSYTNPGYSYAAPPGTTYNSDQGKSFLAGSNYFTVSDYEVFYK